ncbi:hypothetical protein [Fodinibius sediminis]|uniref:Copper resistance protein D n=1 Tax=Fodinibius sediminis TaxID=1214077 RepID=A0A521BU39_9BACT|nr:hypothetical protein [Fodinibius sediminis]SMO50677.1 hypothetical protein SAMN06265218_10427 [Fodinibius sediminis]
MLYSTFYWIHICSYLLWLLAFAGSLFFASRVRGEREPSRKRTYMKRERLATNLGGHLGAIGILISGSMMAGMPGGPQWGWFNMQLYPWLAIKQSFFAVILVLIGFSIRRNRAFRKELNREETQPSDKTARKWNAAYRLSLLVYMLVLINTFLGLVKPF